MVVIAIVLTKGEHIADRAAMTSLALQREPRAGEHLVKRDLLLDEVLQTGHLDLAEFVARVRRLAVSNGHLGQSQLRRRPVVGEPPTRAVIAVVVLK